MPKQPLTPQDKKVKSYQKDGRNRYGENDKASRKAIPKRKASVNRSNRRQEKRALDVAEVDPDAAEEAISTVNKKRWQKSPDRSLAEHIDKAWDYGREGLDERREDKMGLRREAKKRLKKSGRIDGA